MCLISVCKKGTEKLSDKVIAFIKSGASCNTHGSGFAFKREGENTITLKKGFFDVDKLIEAIKEANLGKEDELIIHHRISTSGEVNGANCHPFVISKDDLEVCETNIITDKPVMVHNGVFSSIHKYENLNRNMSDTYAFARYIMSDDNILNLFLTNKTLFETVMDNIIGSDRLCLLLPDRELEMYGRFTEEDGYFHSNGGYCRYVYNRGGVETIKESNGGAGFARNFRANNRHWSKEDFAESSKNFDITTPLALLPSGNNDGSRKLNKIILLDSNQINIDTDNYKHFFFVDKKEYNSSSAGDKLNLFEVHNFTFNVELQATRKKDDFHTIFGSILTKDLLDNCYYIPRSGYYYQIYEDYNKLLELNIYPTSTGIKTLKKSLTHSFRKTAVDMIHYKKVDKEFCKRALEMHLKDMEDFLNTSSLKSLVAVMD